MTSKSAKTASGVEPERTVFDRYYEIERRLRLISGLVLFTFVLMHLLNHAFGIFGLEALEVGQTLRLMIWRNTVGTVVLYGAAFIHFSLALRRIVLRRTWRMPAQEALQIALGLAIPLLVYEHALGTHYVAHYTNRADTYTNVLHTIWPAKAYTQTLLLLVAWTHGVIGIHYVLRSRAWFPQWRERFIVLAVLIPALALAGFVAGGREAAQLDDPALAWTAQQAAVGHHAATVAVRIIIIIAAFVVASVVAINVLRRLGNLVSVRYVGHGSVRLPKGSSVLDGSRSHGIPHPSLCGGRARCSTCRVLVVEGSRELPPPSTAEANILKRISAPPHVRLACQLRPQSSLTVQILMPVSISEGNADRTDEGYKWGRSRIATVLFVDIRAFTKLTETHLPQDLVLVLNRFLAEMRQSVEGHGGMVVSVLSDGIMAVFGLTDTRRHGSRAALGAARDMLRTLETMNRELTVALPMPLRIGIGIHTGPAIIGRVGDERRGFHLTALGETVTIASRLEAATKLYLCDGLVSQETINAAGQGLTASGSKHVIHIHNRTDPIIAYSIDGLSGDITNSDKKKNEEDGATSALPETSSDDTPDSRPDSKTHAAS